MTQSQIDNAIVDVVYDDNVIHHVLEPNEEGIRGIPISQYMMRDRIESIKERLAAYDLTKIWEFEDELRNTAQ